MYIFLKLRFLFSSLVLLKIVKAITKCIFSVMIKVCNEIEGILKSDENASLSQNLLPRTKTNSIRNHHLSCTRSKALNSVDGNIKPTSVRFLVCNLPSGKKFTVRHINKHEVVAKFSDVTYDDLNDFQNKAVTVKSTGPLICLKRDRAFSRKILKSSTPMHHDPKTSRRRKIQHTTNGIETLPGRKHNLKNADEVLIHKMGNASAKSSSIKLDVSEEVHKLKLNEPNRSENSFSKDVSLIIPQQIVECNQKSLSANSVEPRNENGIENGHQENKITQSKEKQSFMDDEHLSGVVTAMHNASLCNQNERKDQNSTHDECHSELITAIPNAFQCNDNERENQSSIDDECHSEIATALQKVYQCNANANISENHADGLFKSDRIKEIDCNEEKEGLGETKEVNTSSTNVNAQMDDFSRKTLKGDLIEHLDQNTKKDFTDGQIKRSGLNLECHSNLPTAMHNSCHGAECHSEIVTAMHNASECDDNESEKVNSVADECNSELTTTIHNASQSNDNESENQNSIDDESRSELVTALEKVFQFQNNENQLRESEKNEHVMGNNCPAIIQVVETKEENILSDSNTDGNLIPDIKVTSSNVVSSDNGSTILEKRDGHCPGNPKVEDVLKELIDQQISISQVLEGIMNIASHLGNSEEENTSQSQKEALNLLKTGRPVYIAFLEEINPMLQEIETYLLNLSKGHYSKSLISEEETNPISSKVAIILKKCMEVNTEPYRKCVILYVSGINDIFHFVQDSIKKSIGNSNCTKRSFFLKIVTRSLTENRNSLFHANEETIAFQSQIQKTGKVAPKKTKNRRRK